MVVPPVPVSVGIVQDKERESAAKVITEIVKGAKGKVAGIKEIELEGSPSPREFLALTLKSVAVPAAKLLTVPVVVTIPEVAEIHDPLL